MRNLRDSRLARLARNLDEIPVKDQQRIQRARNEARIGGREEVLVDAVEDRGRVGGRTPHFRIVHFEGDRQLLGRTVEAEIVGAGANSLAGRLPQAFH